MKVHTSDFKNTIKKFGRELDSIITYTANNDVIELGNNNLNSVTPHYEGALLKSVMKQLDIDSNTDIPVGTEVNYQFGVKVSNNEVEDYRDNYEYINFGNYIVYSSEKQEDTKSYKIVCYDKMLYSMIDYEDINITYPITIRNYLSAICTKLGLTFANSSDTFCNYDKEISNELYLSSDGTSLDYTFRDVLDELAEVTASTICINDDDELEIRYITDTEDTINEEYLKDVNVNFGEQYGSINTIVLSRSAGADNVYYPATLPENPIEIKISDNQIMNGNDRSTYLPDIYNVLNGLTYYLNDFTSTGICYYDLCDRYNISIGGNTYSCIMLNDEVNITQGLAENIHTDLPEESVTDYKKADTTDRKINQTYLMIDKQNQIIQSLIDQSIYISNTINGTGSVTLENAYEGRLYELSIVGQMSLIYPQSDSLYGSSLVPTNILVPSETLVPSVSVPYGNEVNYPSSGIYPKSSVLLIDNKEYVLDLDFLNYLSASVYDEFIYHDGKCKIIRRVGIDSNGDKYALDNEFTEYRNDIDLEVSESSVIRLKLFDNMIYKATYLLDNQYTDVFATKVELNSSITQTAEQITLEVNKKVDENEIISKINQSAEQIQIDANKISLDGKEIDLTAGDITINSNHFNVDSEGNVECNGIQITDGTIQLSDKSSSFGTEFSIESSDPNNVNSAKLKLWGNSIHVESIVNSDNYANFGLHMGSPAVELSSNNENIYSYLGVGELYLKNDYAFGDVQVTSSGVFISNNNTSKIKLQGSNGNITCVSLTQTSREDSKKNFEKYTGALKEILNTDIYKYNLKDEKDTDKKHLGLVIGKKYNYSKEIISIDEKGKEIGVDNYSMTSLCLQAIKEQQEIIENLKERIKKLEESDK